jgi:hypothetical protein
VAPSQRKGLTQIRKAISQTDADESNPNDISRIVVRGAFTVLNAPGDGFLEYVNKNALAPERPNAGLASAQQRGLTISYDFNRSICAIGAIAFLICVRCFLSRDTPATWRT